MNSLDVHARQLFTWRYAVRKDGRLLYVAQINNVPVADRGPAVRVAVAAALARYPSVFHSGIEPEISILERMPGWRPSTGSS